MYIYIYIYLHIWMSCSIWIWIICMLYLCSARNINIETRDLFLPKNLSDIYLCLEYREVIFLFDPTSQRQLVHLIHMLNNFCLQNLSNEIDRIKKENDSLQLELRSIFSLESYVLIIQVYKTLVMLNKNEKLKEIVNTGI